MVLGLSILKNLRIRNHNCPQVDYSSVRIEILLEKGKNSGYHDFSFFHNVFKNLRHWEAWEPRIFMWKVNSLPNDKFLDWSKLKAFANDKIKVTEKMKFVLERVENIVGKGENSGYQHFLLFPQCSQRLHFEGLRKLGFCGEESKSQQLPSRTMFVYKIQVNPIHTVSKYGIYYDFMDR